MYAGIKSEYVSKGPLESPPSNHITITGRITAKPKYCTSRNGQSFLNIFIRFPGYANKLISMQVTLIGNDADKMKNSFREGYVIQVTGELGRDVWQDKNGHHERMKIFASKVKQLVD